MKTLFLFLFVSMVTPFQVFGQDQAGKSDLPQSIAKWESAVAKLEAFDKEQGMVEGGILYYGSSSIRLWRTITEDMAPWPAIQRGYGGAKLPDIIHYADRVIGPRLGKSNPMRCKAVVLFVANDISGKETDASPAEVGSRFDKLHRWIRNKDRDVPVFWIEVTPTNSRWNQWGQIEEATGLIDQIVRKDNNSYLIFTAGAFLGLDGRPRSELFVKDQLHLNKEGYKQWALLIKSQLYARLGAPKPVAAKPADKIEVSSTSAVETRGDK